MPTTRAQKVAVQIIDLTNSDDEEDDRKPSPKKMRVKKRSGRAALIDLTTEDDCLNGAKLVSIVRISSRMKVNGSITYSAPESLGEPELPHSPSNPTQNLLHNPEECAICLEDMADNVVKLNVCTHRFHATCIQQVLAAANDQLCPVCRCPTKEPRGRQSSATLIVSTNTTLDCEGFSGQGSLIISYYFPPGVQKSYHDSPGTAYGGYGTVATFPNNQSGLDLLKRTVYAFSRGLSFDVGVTPSSRHSLLLQASYGIVYPSNNHKSSIEASVKKWEDPTYFQLCHQEFDALNVPPVCALSFDKNLTFSSY